MDTRVSFRPIHPDTEDNCSQRTRRPGVFRSSIGPAPERRSTISNMNCSTNFSQNTRMRNLSGGSSGSTSSSGSSSAGSTLSMDNQYQSDNHFTIASMENFGTNNSGQSRVGSSTHRKLDRSLSDSDGDRLNASNSHRSGNSSRYKTELCRPFEESGSCKYGDKCQFAHGYHELRNLSRHPKYKTELCRTFHTVGFCPYGPRCHFLHEAEGQGKNEQVTSKFGGARQASRASSNYTPTSSSGSCSPSLSPSVSDNDYSAFTYQGDVPQGVNKNFGSNNSNDILSLEQQFSSMKFNTSPANDNTSMYGGNFNTGSSSKTESGYDIFSQITMFNSEEVRVDNSSRMSSSSMSPYSVKVDNFSSFVDTSSFWQNDNLHPQGRSVEQSYHSPTGSTGSVDGSSSECSGSTESLASSGCRDQLGYRDNVLSFTPYSQWIS